MKGRRVAEYGLLAALAMVLAYVEAQIPVFFAVPGMKLGLTNLVVLCSLYRQGPKSALGINIVRIVLTALTFGNMFSMIYSLAGGMLSFFAMLAAKRSGIFGMSGVSVLGGIFHNVGQILVAMCVLETASLIYYLPFLMISGVVAGVVIGVISAMVVARLPVYEG